MSYEPSHEIVERYGRVLVDFALADGAGIKPGDTVLVVGPEESKPLFAEICRAVWRSGGNVIQRLEATQDERFNLERDFLELASDAQLDHFAAAYQRGLVDQIDHAVYIEGTDYPQAMKGVDTQKLLRRQAAYVPAIGWRNEKESAGRFHWTVGLWGTAAMAAEAGLSSEQYWEQIISACFLDDADPVARWNETFARIGAYRDWLNSLPIARLHVEAQDTDLWLTLGERRQWLGGSGRNLPSFEIFTCPDWRGTSGHISFNQPLYTYGALVKGARLEFEDGLVTRASADENVELLEQIIAAPGGNRVGEFSLTDASLSRIDRFMATTLYDENMGGPYGNTHLAVGHSYQAAYDGDPAGLSDDEWHELGFNIGAAVHEDIVATTDRTVTAVMRDGSERVIYAGGHFQTD
ncbi:MAG: aminopeptidase [Acidobacteriota bacterium]|nr:aminopeptidase [Acidobacteriota bacterium]